MNGLLKIADLFDRIGRTVGKAISWIIIPLIFMIMFDVITRKVEFIKDWSSQFTIDYGYSISFILQDLEWHFHGALLLLSFGFGYLSNAHVRVDIFRENVSRRRQVWIELLGLLICAIPFLLVMIYFSWVMTQASFLQGEGSESQVGLGMRFIIKSFLIWGFVVALLAALATLLRCVVYLRGSDGERLAAEHDIQFFTDTVHLPKVVIDPDGSMHVEGARDELEEVV